MAAGDALQCLHLTGRPQSYHRAVLHAQLEVHRQQRATIVEWHRRGSHQHAGVKRRHQGRQRQNATRLPQALALVRVLLEMHHTRSSPAPQACPHHEQMQSTLCIGPADRIAQTA